MTTNDQHTESAPIASDVQRPSEVTNHQPRQMDSPSRDAGFEPGDAYSEPVDAPTDQMPPETVRPQPERIDGEGSNPDASGRHGGELPSEKPLFDDELLTSLRTRWSELQAAFVDDPRACVQKADGLVNDVVGQLVDGFADARSHLERQWGRGEEASTEDLRVALKRYREFFDRLLQV